MISFRYRKTLACAGALVILATALFAARRPILTGLANLVIEEDSSVAADLIVPLNGMFPVNVLAALEAYEAGQAPRIVMTRERKPDGLEELVRRGASVEDITALQARALLELKVPKEAVVTLPGVCERTEEEAYAVKEFLSAHPELKRVLLATSRIHTARAKWIFRRVLGKGYSVHAIASKYDRIHADSWWSDPWYLRRVVTELLANAYVRLFRRGEVDHAFRSGG